MKITARQWIIGGAIALGLIGAVAVGLMAAIGAANWPEDARLSGALACERTLTDAEGRRLDRSHPVCQCAGDWAASQRPSFASTLSRRAAGLEAGDMAATVLERCEREASQ